MRKKIRYIVTLIIIFINSVIIYSLTLNGGLYLPLVYFMYLSPVMLMLLCFNNFRKDELYLWAIIPLLFISYITHKESFRLSTVIYSSLFVLVFILYQRLLFLKSISIKQYRKILEALVFAFFIVLVIQQLGVILHFPVINKNWTADSFKLNSLSYEASNLATILPLIMFSIIKIDELFLKKDITLMNHFKKGYKLWLAFLYTIFTCGSTTAFFTFPMLLLYFFRKKITISSILSVLIIGVVGFYLINYFSPALFERQAKLIPAILSFDVKKIIEVDASAATRIVPIIEYFNRITSLDVNILTGYGVDYSKQFFSNFIVNDSEREIGAGGMAAFIFDYGLIAGILFIVSVIKFTSKKLITYENLFYFTCFFVFGFNHYLTWAYMIFMATNKYFIAKHERYVKYKVQSISQNNEYINLDIKE